MSIEQVQNLILGSGVAGKILAWALASKSRKTVVVERSMVGGSCPNVACLPSKNVNYSAKAVSLVHPTRGLGVVTGSVRADMAGVARRKWRIVNELVGVHLSKFRTTGAELVMGEARFTEPKTVRVTLNAGGTRSLRGERVFINVGTRASIPDVPGLVIAGPMTHVEALNLERLPEHLVILGGGYVGLEFWNKRLGILGDLGACFSFIATVSIIPFMPDGWAASAGGFPAMTGNVPFLMKDLVLLAVSFYLLKQDLVRAALPAAQRHEWREVGGSQARAAGEVAAN
jgi:hypothetical protein